MMGLPAHASFVRAPCLVTALAAAAALVALSGCGAEATSADDGELPGAAAGALEDPPAPAGSGGAGSSCPGGAGLLVTISNERSRPIYMYTDGGCYDPLQTVLAVHRGGAWVDVFGSPCARAACAAGGVAPPSCECPRVGMVRLDPGARLELGPFASEWPQPFGAASAGTCGEAQPLAAGSYQLEVDAMSELDPDVGPDGNCSPGAAGACVTRAQAGDGEVLTQTQDIVLPACAATFTFREP